MVCKTVWHGVCNHTHVNIKNSIKINNLLHTIKIKTIKIMKKLLALAVVILGFTAVSFGQTNSATATATGIIVTPITVNLDRPMDFGTLIASAGSVTLVPAAAATYTGVTAFTGAGTVAPKTAQFIVNGNFSNTYAISVSGLPTTVKHSVSASTMALSAWSSTANLITFTTPTGTGIGTLDGSGVQSFEIGATLTVAAGQEAGTYTSTPFTVTVNYN